MDRKMIKKVALREFILGGLYFYREELANTIDMRVLWLWGSVVWIFQDTQTLKYRAAVGSLLLITIATIFLFNTLKKQSSI